MNDIKLLFEDKFNSVNISKNSDYLVLSKNKATILYDLKKRTKIFEMNSKNVINSSFSENERYLALQKASSIDIYDLCSNKKINSVLTGESCTLCVMYRNMLLYSYKNKKHCSCLIKYNLATQKKETLYSKANSVISLIKPDNDYIVVIFHRTNSDSFTYVKVDADGNISKEQNYEFPGHGIDAITYSENKLFFIQKNNEKNNSYELISIDIDTEKKCKLKNFVWKKNAIQLKLCNNKLYISRFFAVSIIDLLTGLESEMFVFPLAHIGICDNTDYFYIYNGEYVSLYKHLNNSIKTGDGSVSCSS